MEIAVNAIIISNHKVLLIRRLTDSGRPKAFWELPGGNLSYDDVSVEHTAIRTVLDQVGVAIITTGRWFSDSFQGAINIALSAELCDERQAFDIRLDQETKDYKWADLSDIYCDLVTPLTRERIASLLTS